MSSSCISTRRCGNASAGGALSTIHNFPLLTPVLVFVRSQICTLYRDGRCEKRRWQNPEPPGQLSSLEHRNMCFPVCRAFSRNTSANAPADFCTGRIFALAQHGNRDRAPQKPGTLRRQSQQDPALFTEVCKRSCVPMEVHTHRWTHVHILRRKTAKDTGSEKSSTQ